MDPGPSILNDHTALDPNPIHQTEDRNADTHQYVRRRPEGWDETQTTVPKKLGALDLVAVVANKMLGSGIFTTPGQVLLSTGSKQLGLVLWAMGGLYTWLSLAVYLELGAQFPHNGGELIYLDRTLRPGLMFTLAFSAFYIAISDTTGNALAFARFTMAAAVPDFNQAKQDADSRVVKLIAINILSVVCLLHYFSRDLGLFLNKLLALYKLGLLVTVMAANFWVASNVQYAGLDDGDPATTADAESNLYAFVLVLYSYTGWENANYVAGEIADREGGVGKTLRTGAYTAVVIVSLAYFFVTLSYYLAFSYTEITGSLDLGMAQNLGAVVKAFAPRGVSLDILFALSALGNLIAVVYTNGKVKQAIARQRLLPFWPFWQRDTYSPKGGVVLHWIFTTIMIIAVPSSSDGYTFVVGLYTYGQIVVVTFVTIGLFLWLVKKNTLEMDTFQEVAGWLVKNCTRRWPAPTQTWLMSRIWRTSAIVVAVLGTNGIVISLAAAQINTTIPGWLLPTVVGSAFGFGVACWCAGYLLLTKVKRVRPDDPTPATAETVGRRLGWNIWVYESREPVWPFTHARYDDFPSSPSDWHRIQADAQADGTQRRLHIELDKIPKEIAGWPAKAVNMGAKVNKWIDDRFLWLE